VGTAEGQAYGDHVPFGHHGLDLDPDVGELFVQAREGTLHTFGSASDLGYVGAKLVLFGEQFVRQIQVPPIYHLVDGCAAGQPCSPRFPPKILQPRAPCMRTSENTYLKLSEKVLTAAFVGLLSGLQRQKEVLFAPFLDL
jgi:hypothetical protein